MWTDRIARVPQRRGSSRSSPSSQNLDLYILTEELGVRNPSRQGTSPGAVESVCLELGAGAYYAMATNVDLTRSGSIPTRSR